MSYEKYYPGGWQSGESGGTPITPEALNHIENGIKQTYSDFAPAGYGLGSSPKSVNYATINSIHETGWYYTSDADVSIFGYDHIFFEVIGIDSNNSVQIAYPLYHNSGTKNYCLRRQCSAGAWGEWEWVNPPMIPVVEYRTTERHNGKVKYKKLISFGEFPQSTSKEVSTGIDANKYRIVGVHRHAKEIGNNADILHLASITHEHTVVYSGLYFIHVTTNGSQSVTAEYLFEYEEV